MMNNIFYDATVHLNVLLNKYIPVSAALSDEQILPPLENAFSRFVRPLLGDDLAEKICRWAHGLDGDMSTTQQKVLDVACRAVANLAFYDSFELLNVHITDQGFQRQEGESFKPLYRYQEIELKQQFRNKGFNAIDELIALLNSSIAEVPEFAQSPAYIDMRHALVKGASEIEVYCHINRSSIIYKMLEPLFKLMLETKVELAIGPQATEFLHAYLNGTFDVDSDDAVLGEKLRAKVASVVILLSLGHYVKNVGSVTDRGLYFSQDSSSASVNDSDQPAREADRLRKADEFDRLADSYLHRLVAFIECEMEERYAGNPHDVLNRCNEHKKTFWA